MNDFLKNKKKFDNLLKIVKLLISKNKIDEAIRLASDLAIFATNNQTGYYVSYKLENELKIIANKINHFDLKRTNNKDNKRRKVLHVVTQLYPTGGHTRLLKNWIIRDKESEHAIVSTLMLEEKLKEVTSFFEINNVDSYVLKGNYISKVKKLKELSINYDFIILHTHQFDIIPVLVYSSLKNETFKVLLMNHADHSFWLGVTISNTFIYFRENIKKGDNYRRSIPYESQFYLPLPIKKEENIKSKDFNEKILKEKIGIKQDAIVLLCISSAYKLTPFKSINFFKDVCKLLEKNKKLVLLLIGANEDDYYSIRHERIKYLGVQKKIDTYLSMADIYLENFPLGSFTSVLDAMNYNIPVQLMHSPNETLKILPQEYGFKYSKNYFDWENNVLDLVKNKNKRDIVVEKQNKYLEDNNYSNAWKSRLNNLYQIENKLKLVNKQDVFCNTENEIFFNTYKKKKDNINYHKFLKVLSLKDLVLNYFLIKIIIYKIYSKVKSKIFS